MAEPARRKMTVEEFLRFKGHPVAMNPPMGCHRTVVTNLGGLQMWKEAAGGSSPSSCHPALHARGPEVAGSRPARSPL